MAIPVGRVLQQWRSWLSVSLPFGTRVCIVGLLFALAQPVKADPPLPVIPSRTTNVLSFGAFGNGSSNNAAAINAAITAINTAGGGTVVISPGSPSLTNYLSGPITMKSKVNLQIDSGTKLQMLPMSSWTSGTTPFIFGNTLTDVEISGTGTLDGNAGFDSNSIANWWGPPPPANTPASNRPNFVQFDHCTRVWIRGVTLQNPPTFTIYLKNSDTSVTIEDIRIDTTYQSHNTDAFDISSTNILIRNSYISTGDDNAELGGSGAAATDITISNCTFGTGHGLSCGSKIGGGVNNVLVSNCWWIGTEYGIKMKSDRGSGGVVSNMKYMDLHMTNVNFPIAFYMDYTALGSPSKTINVGPADAAANAPQTFSSSTPVYQNITINNLEAVGNNGIQGPGNIACFFYGLPESPITNVTMSNVNILGRGSDGTICMYYVKGIQIIDSNLTAPLTGTNVLTLYSAEFTVTNSAVNTNLVTIGGLGSPSNNVPSFFNGRFAITDTTVDGKGPFTLGGSTLTFSQGSVNFSNNLNVVSASTLGFTSGNNTYRGVLSGAGALTFNLPGSSVLTLLGNSSGYSGSLTASNGTVLVNNTAGSGTGTGALTVLGAATLGGTGVISGPVTMTGTLAPGTSPGTLTISNNLVINSAAMLRYELGTSSDQTVVSGNLTVDGTLNVTDAGGFTNTTYKLLKYGGILTDNGLTIGTTPSTNFTYAIATGVAGEIDLVVSNAAAPPPVDPFVAWQQQYFGCTNCPQAAADADSDGDGMSNTNEFLAGTNPTNSLSALRIVSVTQETTNIVVTWQTVGGRTNILQSSSGDAGGGYNTNGFADVGGQVVIPGVDEILTNQTDWSGATNVPSRYYRIRLVL